MPRKNRQNRKAVAIKSSTEKQNYSRFIAKSPVSPEATISTYSKALHGSNEYSPDDSYYTPAEKPVPTPLRISIGDWLKEHSVELLVVVIIMGVIGWLCVTVINLSLDSRELMTKMDAVQEDIDTLSEDIVSKEILELELDALQSEIKNATIFDIDDLSDRIAVLEKQIALVNDTKTP